MAETPFDSLHSAFAYVSMLLEAVRETRGSVAEDLEHARENVGGREAEALQLVAFKLDRLETHLAAGRRLLNDLRRLRRVLVGEGENFVEQETGPGEDPGDLL